MLCDISLVATDEIIHELNDEKHHVCPQQILVHPVYVYSKIAKPGGGRAVSSIHLALGLTIYSVTSRP
jgi:hypothetical protein